MKLQKVSFFSSLAVTGTLLISLFLLWQVYKTHQNEFEAQENRQKSIQTVNNFRTSIFELNQLVKAYIATADPKYLIYYYDLLAIDNGVKKMPINYNSSAYWFSVIAGETEHKIPKGEGFSISQKMRKEGFSTQELLQLDSIFSISEKIKKIEQIAFAATQGLYDTKEKKFVDDGEPNMEYASHLVYSQEYIALNAKLYSAIEKLIHMTQVRTANLVSDAEEELKQWLVIAIFFMILTTVLILTSFIAVRKYLLKPIALLIDATERISHGDYSFRLYPLKWLEELSQLAITFNHMTDDISRDIEHRELHRVELEKAKVLAEDAARTKAMFLANMSHEIRTPMNAIIGMSYLALQTKLTKKQKEFIEQVNSAAKSLLGIINDILDFSKIEAGKMIIENNPFELKTLINELVNMHKYQVKTKNIEFIFEQDDALLRDDAPYLVGDKLRVAQILNNLLSNAIKFTDSGFVKISVESQRVSDNRVDLAISIEDTGIGMSKAQLARLFQEFTQMDDSTSRKYGGTGLGLAISRNLAQIMDANVYAKSVESEGSTFIFEKRFETLVVDRTKIEEAKTPKVNYKTFKGTRVLLVEDNEMNQRLAVELLSAKGIEIVLANNGKEAVETLFSHDVDYFDMVLMDIQMPILNGYEATKEIRENSDFSELPIIAMTASVLSEELEKYISIGMQDYISKPIEPDKLFETIAKYSQHLPLEEEVQTTQEESEEIIIEGLDTKRGLKYSGNSKKLYIEMLEDFVKKYENIESNIKTLAQEDDLTTAERLSHTFKGILGTLGATHLQPKAAMLEEAFKDKDALYALKILDEFKSDLESLIYNVKNYLNNVTSEINISNTVGQDSSWLKECIRELQDSSFDAIEEWEEKKNSLQGTMSEKDIEAVSAALCDFDFDEALKILEKVESNE